MSGSAAPPVTLSDRLLKAFRALVREELPRLTFYGLYEYIVAVPSATSDTVAGLVPSDTTIGLPNLTNVPLRLSFTTASFAAPGSKVLVAFVNGDPSRPIVLEADNSTGAQISISSPATQRAARMGDGVTAGPFTGTIVSGSPTVKIG